MILNLNSSTNLSGFYIIFNGTIKNETIGIRGISHFIEHLICKGFKDLLDNFEENGITWNAYTSDSRIVFYITGLDEYVNEYKNKYLDKICNFDIKTIDFDLEKKIILEEYIDTFNNQSTSHYLNLYRKLFNDYNPIGELNDIKNLKKENCEEYWNKYYKYPSKIINVSKNNIYNRNLEFNNFNNDYEIKYLVNNDFIYQKINIFNNKISVIYLSKIIDSDYKIVNFITLLLSSGLRSPFYQETREKYGLVYYINCYLDNITDNYGVINISADIDEKNINKFYDRISNVMNNKENFIDKKRFDIVKKSNQILYKKAEINKYNNVNKYIIDKKWLLEDIIDDITLDMVYDVYDKYFNINDYYISYDKKEFEKK